MKKILLSLLFLFSFGALVTAQNVAREMVLLEIGTGTWCTYCPGAAMGADDLLENGKFVAVVENHNGDAFANTYSNNRNSMYGVSAFPSAAFDGREGYVGGSHSSSMYNNYLPKYNTCIAIDAPVTMSMTETHTGLDYTVDVTLTKVGTITASNIVMYFFVTLSNIQFNWQGQTHLEHVNMLMVPGTTGTTIDFTSGNTQTVTLTFSLDSQWPVEDLEFIATLQNKDNGQGNIPGTSPYSLKKWEVLQTIKRGVVDLTPDFTASATAVPGNTSVTFTNGTFGGYIGVPETYEWQFPGATPGTSTDENPTVTYTECGPHDVTLIVNRGGQIDTLVKTQYIQVGPVINIAATPGDTACWYQPITLDATTPDAVSYLWTPGNFDTPTITLDGSVVGVGTHTYSVHVVTSDGCFSDKEQTIVFDACTGIPETIKGMNAVIYPNPNPGQFTLELNSEKSVAADLKVVNVTGSTVYQENGLKLSGKVVKSMNLNLPNGLYYLILQSGEGRTTQKLFINR